MALNPLLDARGYPQLFPQEVIVIIYPGVYGTLQLENNFKIRSHGTLYLSNARIVYVNNNPSQTQYNFALHLNLISREKPVYMSAALTVFEGYTLPYGTYLPAPGIFKFEMTQDPRPFITNISRFLTQIRSSGMANAPTPSPERAQTIGNQAFVDPSDPDIIYIVDKQ